MSIMWIRHRIRHRMLMLQTRLSCNHRRVPNMVSIMRSTGRGRNDERVIAGRMRWRWQRVHAMWIRHHGPSRRWDTSRHRWTGGWVDERNTRALWEISRHHGIVRVELRVHAWIGLVLRVHHRVMRDAGKPHLSEIVRFSFPWFEWRHNGSSVHCVRFLYHWLYDSPPGVYEPNGKYKQYKPIKTRNYTQI